MTPTPAPTDRTGLRILTRVHCERLLAATPVGRVAFCHEGEPVVLPVNHVVQGLTIGFRCAPGTKLDAARSQARVAFQVDGHDPRDRSGWSVLAIGLADRANPIERAHFEDAELTPWADGAARDHWVAIRIARLSGRWTGRPPRLPDA